MKVKFLLILALSTASLVGCEQKQASTEKAELPPQQVVMVPAQGGSAPAGNAAPSAPPAGAPRGPKADDKQPGDAK